MPIERRMFASLAALEAELEQVLPVERLRGRPPSALIAAARRWSDAVWAGAAQLGPSTLGVVDRATGLDVARRPVFVCGAHRSGTTLVRDLLDDHPALAVLPSEGTFWTAFARQLGSLRPSEHLPHLGREWLRRLANPINRPPYWLLGRTCRDVSGYVDFARALMAWWPATESAIARQASMWPLVAVALAYASSTGRLTAGTRLERWVEKTPGNERFVDRLQQEFPSATIVHVIRDPMAVVASRKRLAADAMRRGSSGDGPSPPRMGLNAMRQVLRDLAMSYRTASEQKGRHASEYLVLRYEDLIADPPSAVRTLAEALGIELLPILMQPSVNGIPSSANSAIPLPQPDGVILPRREHASALTDAEKMMIAGALGDLAHEHGYKTAALKPWQRRVIKWSQAGRVSSASRRLGKRGR